MGRPRGDDATSITLPVPTNRLLHATRRHRRRRAGHGDAGGRVDNGDGVAGAGGSGLVEFQAGLLVVVVRLLIGAGVEGRRVGVEGEAGGDVVGLLSGGGLGRVTRQGRALGCAVDGDQLMSKKRECQPLLRGARW